jgi:hypothetical protein
VITFLVNRAWTFRMSGPPAIAAQTSIPRDGQAAIETRGARRG